MQHEDGYCDRCGCEAETAWLTVMGDELCRECATATPPAVIHGARRPEARDDGR